MYSLCYWIGIHEEGISKNSAGNLSLKVAEALTAEAHPTAFYNIHLKLATAGVAVSN